MAQYIIRNGDGQEIGPLGGREIRARVARGELGPADLLRPAEGGRWRPLASVPGLAGELQLGAQFKSEVSSAADPVSAPPASSPEIPPPALPVSARAADADADAIDLGVSDRVFRLGFAIGRVVSVIVIVLAVLAILGAAAVLVVNELTPVPKPPPAREVALPQVQEFVTTCDTPERPAAGERPQARQASGSAGTLDPCGPWRVRVEHVCRAMTLPQDARDIVCRTVSSFDPADREGFLDGFVRFSDAFAALSPKPAGCSAAAAADWYIEAYRQQVRARDIAAKEAQDAHSAFLVSRDARRWQSTLTAGAALGALVLFLVLPLLIQIERNTRMLGRGA